MIPLTRTFSTGPFAGMTKTKDGHSGLVFDKLRRADPEFGEGLLAVGGEPDLPTLCIPF
jgi:hypothetical protein